jgi:hypothetical protein
VAGCAACAPALGSYAIGELNGFDSTTPLPCEPTGSPLGDALDTVAAVTRAAQRKPGYSPELTWALMGRLGLARYLQPARAGCSSSANPGHRHARGPAATLTVTMNVPGWLSPPAP